MPEHAVKAYTELDGTIFHGRMMHLLPGKAKVNLEDGNGLIFFFFFLIKNTFCVTLLFIQIQLMKGVHLRRKRW